ncbi:MAG: hemolysin III family protein [Chloroflexi bacterium]|nr:hemolysin III family protein [Chloroflexota bacterium]
MAFQKSDLFNFYSHLTGAVVSLAGYIVLLCVSGGDVTKIILSSIYSVCAIFIFACSSIYHGQKEEQDDTSPWRKLDHIAIFFMIAGTYTPISWVYLDVYWRWSIIGAQWLLVVLGLVFKLIYIKSPRWLTIVIYLLMGWMALIPLGQLLATMPFSSIMLLFAGGVAYSVGAVIYALKKPDPFPGVFGFHEIFHSLIIIGAVLHYLMVFTAIKG